VRHSGAHGCAITVADDANAVSRDRAGHCARALVHELSASAQRGPEGSAPSTDEAALEREREQAHDEAEHGTFDSEDEAAAAEAGDGCSGHGDRCLSSGE
jgi:hypothetical protein